MQDKTDLRAERSRKVRLVKALGRDAPEGKAAVCGGDLTGTGNGPVGQETGRWSAGCFSPVFVTLVNPSCSAEECPVRSTI